MVGKSLENVGQTIKKVISKYKAVCDNVYCWASNEQWNNSQFQM